MDDSNGKIKANLDANLIKDFSKSISKEASEKKKNNYNNIIEKKKNDHSPFQTDNKITTNKNSLNSNIHNLILGKRSHQKYIEFSSILNNEKSKENDKMLIKPSTFIIKKPKIEITKTEKECYYSNNKQNNSGKDYSNNHVSNKLNMKIKSNLKLLKDVENNKINSINLLNQKFINKQNKQNLDAINLNNPKDKTDKKENENSYLENNYRNLSEIDKPLDLMDICNSIYNDNQNPKDVFLLENINQLKPDIHKEKDNDNKNENENTSNEKEYKAQSKQNLEGIFQNSNLKSIAVLSIREPKNTFTLLENRGRALKKQTLNENPNSPYISKITNKFYSRSVSRNEFFKHTISNVSSKKNDNINKFDPNQKTNLFSVENNEENGKESLNNIESNLKRRNDKKTSEEIILEEMAKHKFTALPLKKEMFSVTKNIQIIKNKNTNEIDCSNILASSSSNLYYNNLHNQSQEQLPKKYFHSCTAHLLKYSEKKENQLISLKTDINKQTIDSKFNQDFTETNTNKNLNDINNKFFKSDNPMFFSHSKNITSLRNGSELENNIYKGNAEGNKKIKQCKIGVNTDLFKFTNSIKAKSNSKNLQPVYFNKIFKTLSSINTSKYAKNLNVSNSVFNLTKNLKIENNNVQSKSLYENESPIISENKEKIETENSKQEELKNKINEIDLNYLQLNKNEIKNIYQEHNIKEIKDLNEYENQGIINQKNEIFNENINKIKEFPHNEENLTKAHEAVENEKNDNLMEFENKAGVKENYYMDICKKDCDKNLKKLEKEELKKSTKANNLTTNEIKKISDANFKTKIYEKPIADKKIILAYRDKNTISLKFPKTNKNNSSKMSNISTQNHRNKSCKLNLSRESNNTLNNNFKNKETNSSINSISSLNSMNLLSINRKFSHSISNQMNEFKNKCINTSTSIITQENSANLLNRKNSHDFIFLNKFKKRNDSKCFKNEEKQHQFKFSLTIPISPKLRTKERMDERNKRI